ncbi:MAG TPA: entericidin A/B family lipoprotein [Azospirillum sp.]|nr:entericidin A/B family lipoprotein [Azospirillum sp.]
MLSFLVALTAMLSGCNTMEGMGRDVQSGGRALERSAD